MIILAERHLDNIGFTCAIIGYLFSCGTIYGSDWSTYNYTPWANFCPSNNKNCKTPNYIYSTRAFITIAIIVMTLSFIIDRLNKFRDIGSGGSDRGKQHMIIGVMWIFSAVCQIIALACYTAYVNDYNKVSYGWSYGLGWAGLVFEIIGGGLFLYWGRV